MFFNLDMTFIISLQLKDSIVITADKKEVVINEEEIDSFNEHHTLKLHAWDNGVITGTGGKLCNSSFHNPFQRSSSFKYSQTTSMLRDIKTNQGVRNREVSLSGREYQNPL